MFLSRSRFKDLESLESISFERQKYYDKNRRRKEEKIYRDLSQKGVIIYQDKPQKYKLTELGKIVLKKLGLLEFSQLQFKLSENNFVSLLSQVKQLKCQIKETSKYLTTDYYQSKPVRYQKVVLKNQKNNQEKLKQALIDLKIYQAQYQRVLRNNLYFLQIESERQIFYKVGVTSRDIQERIREIYTDLSKLFKELSISLLGIWIHRGNIEHYFKYKYEGDKFSLGKYTEYFQFEDIQPILNELNTLFDKQLSPLEQKVLSRDQFY